MGEPLALKKSVSEDKLQSEFPFIRQGGGNGASRKEYSPPPYTKQQKPSAVEIQRRDFPAEVFLDLTKRELQGVLEILHYSVQATTVDDIYHVLQLIQRFVACPRVIGGVAQLNSKGTFGEFNSVINVSYSNDWLYAYGKNGYADVDPVLQSVLSTSQTQVWKQTYKNADSTKQIEFVEEARSYGLTHGITTGMVEQKRNFASFFSFAGGDSSDTIRYKELIDYLLPYLHRVLIANTHTPTANRVMGLSSRETAVLDWMKQGKTNWEISRIIGVSERTVRFHAESIFMKLDVGSRTQAVAFAIEHGLLPGA